MLNGGNVDMMKLQMPNHEKRRINIAKYLVDYLKNKKINSLTLFIKDKKLFYSVIFCLSIVGEALDIKKLKKSCEDEIFIKYARALYLLRENIVHRQPRVNKLHNSFKSRNEIFLDSLCNIFKQKIGLNKLKVILNNKLNNIKLSGEYSKLFENLKNNLENVPVTVLKSKSIKYIFVIKSEIAIFEQFSSKVNFNEIDKVKKDTYYALLCSFCIITNLMYKSKLNIFNENKKISIKSLRFHRNKMVHNFEFDRKIFKRGGIALKLFFEQVNEIKNRIKAIEKPGLKIKDEKEQLKKLAEQLKNDELIYAPVFTPSSFSFINYQPMFYVQKEKSNQNATFF